MNNTLSNVVIPTAILLSVIVVTSGITFSLIQDANGNLDEHKNLPSHLPQYQVSNEQFENLDIKIDRIYCIVLANTNEKDPLGCLK